MFSQLLSDKTLVYP